MIRKLFGFFCVILLCLSLSGCHGSRQTVSFVVPEEFDSDRQYEISFWAKNDTNINQVNIYKKAIEDFHNLYPNITVNMKLYTDYGRIYNDVITNISTDTTPNVCITYPDHIATYMTGNNVVVNLDELIDNEKYGLGGSELKYDGPEKEEMIKEFFDECIIKGNYYALPYMRSTEALYINKTYVEKLGFSIDEVVSWDFIWQVCEKAMAKDDDGNFVINGQKVMIPFIYKSTDNMMITMLKQLDGAYSTDNGEILLFNDTSKKLLSEIGKHASNGEFSTFKISGYPANFLNAGQCIFAIDSTAGATWMGTDAPLVDIPEDKLVEFETVVRPVPQFEDGKFAMISQGPSLCIFNKEDNNEVLASWLFAQYLLSNDVQIPYSQTEGYVPVTSKAQSSDEYKQYLSLGGSDDVEHYSIKIDAVNLLLDNIDNTFVTPVFNGSASLRDAAGNLIESVCKATRKKQTIDNQYLDNLFEETNSLYHLDQSSAVNSGGDLGPLPLTSKLLLSSLAGIWIIIGIYWFITNKKAS